VKIAHVTSALGHEGAGLRTVVEALSARQEKVGHEVRVFGLESPSWNAGANAAWTGAPATVLPVKGPGAIGYAPSLAPSLLSFGPDVIHLHGLWTYPSLAAFSVSRKLGIARVISPHGMLDQWALAQSSAKKRAALALFERSNLAGATIHALCNSEVIAVRALGIRAPITVIPNGTDLPAISLEPTTQPVWHGRLPSDAHVMLFLGRIHPKKGLASLIQAMARELATVEAGCWYLVVAGWDQEGHRAELQALVEENDLDDRVHFVGPVFGREKLAALSAAQLFVLPSFSEGLPMSVLEAWACNLPVLMTPQCNLPEGAAARAAWIVEPDPASLAAKLAEVLDMPAEVRAEFGRNGARLVTERFNWEVVEAQFTALYKSLANGGERPKLAQSTRRLKSRK
jgi:glycosyltransferase involved in cell wall biosynthesis